MKFILRISIVSILLFFTVDNVVCQTSKIYRYNDNVIHLYNDNTAIIRDNSQELKNYLSSEIDTSFFFYNGLEIYAEWRVDSDSLFVCMVDHPLGYKGLSLNFQGDGSSDNTLFRVFDQNYTLIPFVYKLRTKKYDIVIDPFLNRNSTILLPKKDSVYLLLTSGYRQPTRSHPPEWIRSYDLHSADTVDIIIDDFAKIPFIIQRGDTAFFKIDKSNNNLIPLNSSAKNF